jgi:hypothetical protein
MGNSEAISTPESPNKRFVPHSAEWCVADRGGTAFGSTIRAQAERQRLRDVGESCMQESVIIAMTFLLPVH